MKPQHRTETPRQRHHRGLRMSGDDLADLAYLRGIETTLTAEQRKAFNKILFSSECRGQAGIRPAADRAVRILRERAAQAIAGGVVMDSWRAR